MISNVKTLLVWSYLEGRAIFSKLNNVSSMRLNTSKKDISFGLLFARPSKNLRFPSSRSWVLISLNTPNGRIILPRFLAYKSSAAQYSLLKYSSFSQAIKQSQSSIDVFKADGHVLPWAYWIRLSTSKYTADSIKVVLRKP